MTKDASVDPTKCIQCRKRLDQLEGWWGKNSRTKEPGWVCTGCNRSKMQQVQAIRSELLNKVPGLPDHLKDLARDADDEAR